MEQQKTSMGKRQFRIGDLAKELKVKKFVIRFWEKEFNLKSDRSHGGQRFYSKEDFDTFLLIKDLLYSQGFTILGAKRQLDAVLKGDVIPAQKYVTEQAQNHEIQNEETKEEEVVVVDSQETEELEHGHEHMQAQEEIMPASSQDLAASNDFTVGTCCLHAQPESVDLNNSNNQSIESIEQTIKEAIEDAKKQAKEELEVQLKRQLKEQLEEKLEELIAQERQKIRLEFIGKVAPIKATLVDLKKLLDNQG